MQKSKGLQVPAWIWTLLVIFIIDDLLVWIKSPSIFVPFLLILIVIGVSFAVGQKDLPINLAR